MTTISTFFVFCTVCMIGVSLFPVCEARCDQCQFDGKDSRHCKVYGQLRDRRLIGWEKADRYCLNFYNVQIRSLGHTDLSLLFPDVDGQNGYVNSFVDWLKSDTGAVSNDIKLGYEEFWDDQNGVAVLKKTINVGGTEVKCEGSLVCYTAIKSYFRVDPGASEMAAIGKQLHKQQRRDRELEQSLIRIRICNSGDTPECGALNRQVQLNKKQQPDRACSAFGLGPGNITIPGCGPDASNLRGGDDGDDLSNEGVLGRIFRQFTSNFFSGWLGQASGVGQLLRLA